MLAAMFCPKCGAAMEERGGEMYCVPGGMGLAPVVRMQLEAIVAGTSRTTRRPDQSFRWGGSWFCPADGTPMVEVDGVLECGQCDRALGMNVLPRLIETHPHPGRRS